MYHPAWLLGALGAASGVVWAARAAQMRRSRVQIQTEPDGTVTMAKESDFATDAEEQARLAEADARLRGSRDRRSS